ncbi:MAG: UDP-glucose 4-epimerase, partial [Synergistales bacterium]|nr:UDP-glucose 4-epimerase [Synergistales bacterium]
RQAIAESWPDSLACSAARKEWDFAPRYDLETMTREMLDRIASKGGRAA